MVETKWEPNAGSLGSSVLCSDSSQAFNLPNFFSEHILCAECCLVWYAFFNSFPTYYLIPKEESMQDGSSYPYLTEQKLEAQRRIKVCSKQHN